MDAGDCETVRGTMPFEERYYEEHALDQDRVALAYYARLVRRLCPRGGRVLDFGCGTGHLLRRLSERFQALGYDVSPTARSRCRLNAPDAVVLEDWTTLDPQCLDTVVSLHTFEHLDRPLPAITALGEKLRAGGTLLFVVPNPGGLGRSLKGRHWFAYRDPTHVSLLSRGEWVQAVRRAGLETLWVRGDGMWDPPYVALLPRFLQLPLFGGPAAVQMLWPGRPFIPGRFGECLIVAAQKPAPGK